MAEKTSETQTHHKPSYVKDLVLLFAIPASIAIIAALAVYVPRLMAHPQYDFIYAACDSYSCENSFSVNADGLVTESFGAQSEIISPYSNQSQNETLRYYDARTDSTRSITLEQTRSYSLNTSSRSPDGYTLSQPDSGSGFLFWDNYDQGWYLKNGAKRKKVDLLQTRSYYSSDVTFLGWVNK
jgi:hypothetical protein